MKLCQTCQAITADTHSFCPHDGAALMTDPLATALQESLGAKYSVTRLIGTGSMGAVYRAQHQSLDEVAIKVMLGTPGNQKLSERFLREARALRKLRHQNAVLVYDLERSANGLTYMVMEFVEGRSLRDVLKERRQLALEESLVIAEAVCDALQAAHERGIIHRDLKPDNILLAEEKRADGTVARIIKIADFGIVKLRGTKRGGAEASMQLTNHGAPIGTPLYMSPEQWFGDGPGIIALDGRTDIYSLACTLYEMLGGRPPFLGQTTDELRDLHLKKTPRPLHQLASSVPETVSRVIMRALEKDRDLRPASAREFAAELRRAFQESISQPSKAQSETPAAKREIATEREAKAKPPAHVPSLQKTEEAMPMIRNWANQEAQPAIEEVRKRPIPEVPVTTKPSPVKPTEDAQPVEQRPDRTSPPLTEQPPVRQKAPARDKGVPVIEDFETTFVQTKPRAKAEPSKQVDAARQASTDAELRRTLIFERPPKHAPAKEAAPEAEREKYRLTIAQVGAQRIALLADETDTTVTGRAPVPLPSAPAAVLGVVSVRGRMLTLIDPLALLGEERTTEINRTPAFIIPLHGDEQLALAVDSIEGELEISLHEIEPSNHNSDRNAIRGIIHQERGAINIIDIRELFDAALRGSERRRQRT